MAGKTHASSKALKQTSLSTLNILMFRMQCMVMDYPLHIIARKFINTEPAFHAFNGMPVTRERRYFIKDGQVIGHHPYWPPHAIQQPTVENWQPLLDELNQEPDDEVAYLTGQSEIVAQAIPGFWSVDWLMDADGNWYCIDMAEGNSSFIWNEYLEQSGQGRIDKARG